MRTKVAIGRVALLLACGQSLEDARLQLTTVEDGSARTVSTGIDSDWYGVVDSADVDLDGDDELLVVGYPGVGAMQADGRATIILDGDAQRAFWSPRPAGDSADLFAWIRSPGITKVTHAACDLGQAPTCTVSGTIAIAGALDSMAAGDFDEDGGVDLVTLAADSVLLHRSTGDDWRHPDWSEATQLLVTSGWDDEHSVVSGDLDGDGHLDIVVAAGSFGVRLFFGAGDGTFGQVRPAINDSLEWVTEVHLAQLDGVGVPELVLVTDGGPVALRRLRERSFAGSALPIPKSAGAYASELEVVAGDLDGDDRDELWIIDEDGPAWLVERGGQWGEWTTTSLGDQSAELRYWTTRVAADLDGDGRDVLAAVVPKDLPLECAIGGAAARR